MLVKYLKKRIHSLRTVNSWLWSLSLSLTHTRMHAHWCPNMYGHKKYHGLIWHTHVCFHISSGSLQIAPLLAYDIKIYSGCFAAWSVFFHTLWTSKGIFYLPFLVTRLYHEELQNYAYYLFLLGLRRSTENSTKENAFHWYV